MNTLLNQLYLHVYKKLLQILIIMINAIREAADVAIRAIAQKKCMHLLSTIIMCVGMPRPK